LRHYDQYGLLKPNALDPDTSYRYYSLDQLPRLHRILALKDLGFPLEQIAQLLEHDLSLEQLRTLFELKRTTIQQIIATEQGRLARVAARLRQIEQEGIMPIHDIRLKQVEPLLVASVRASIPTAQDIGRLQAKLFAYLDQQGIQITRPDLVLLHSRHELSDEGISIDAETAVPLQAMLPGNEQVTIRTLPGGLMACTVHTGNALSLGQAYVALHRWLQENGYRPVGPIRQVRLQRGEELNPNQYVTELQFPVEKRQE
jgi:effector-binding domain-containing protein